MRKFRFKFATLESLRKSREEAALRVLGAAQRAFQATTEQKLKYLAELSQALDRRENLAQAVMQTADFAVVNDFITGTKQRIIQTDQAIFRARKQVEKALRNYLGARRQTRVIELLREKDFQEYKRAYQKAERRSLDDLNLMRFRINQEQSG